MLPSHDLAMPLMCNAALHHVLSAQLATAYNTSRTTPFLPDVKHKRPSSDITVQQLKDELRYTFRQRCADRLGWVRDLLTLRVAALPRIQSALLARVMATFMRLMSDTKPMPVCRPGSLARTHDMMTTSICLPWKLSTVSMTTCRAAM